MMKKIKALITRYKPAFTYTKYKYLSHNYIETRLQMLSKAIKEQNKEFITDSEPKDLNLRPIVGRPKCLT